jgi:hypothetical protein
MVVTDRYLEKCNKVFSFHGGVQDEGRGRAIKQHAPVDRRWRGASRNQRQQYLVRSVGGWIRQFVSRRPPASPQPRRPARIGGFLKNIGPIVFNNTPNLDRDYWSRSKIGGFRKILSEYFTLTPLNWIAIIDRDPIFYIKNPGYLQINTPSSYGQVHPPLLSAMQWGHGAHRRRTRCRCNRSPPPPLLSRPPRRRPALLRCLLGRRRRHWALPSAAEVVSRPVPGASRARCNRHHRHGNFVTKSLRLVPFLNLLGRPD